MGKRNLVLSVVVVPNIKPAVFSGQEESTDPGRGEAAIANIAVMIFGLDQWGLEIVHPKLSTPVTHGHEDFRELKIPGD